MKRFILMATMLILCLSLSYSQVETRYLNSGEAMKLINKPVRSTGVVKEMPSFDLAQLEKEDAERDGAGGTFRFGKPFDVFYTLDDGQWEDVDGGRMWSMTFKSEGAISLNFVFNDFWLPEGAELYVVNKDKSVLFGPVTKESTTDNGFFLTDIIKGDQVSILLFEPIDNEGKSSLTIKEVVHGYRSFESSVNSNDSRSVGNKDVACCPEYETESDAVALILYSNGFEMGSGFLVMSTDYSFKPYLMTSSFCVDTNNDGVFSTAEISTAENDLFKFRYKKDECNGTNFVTSYTYNQAYFRSGWANNNSSKFALLELKSNLKQNTALSWLGWNYLVYSPSSGALIHHPENDGMKIASFYHNVGFVGSEYNFLWDVSYEEGMGGPLTRGAPLLNQYNEVVGQVYYSVSFISTEYTIVGKFYKSWEGGGTSETRLSNWLDPYNTGQWYMDSHRSLGDLQIIGDSVITSGSSHVYYLSNLPSGMTVTWSISDSYYQGVLRQDYPNTNQCSILGNVNQEVVNATLKASVYNGSTLVQTAYKTVSTEEHFHGTYYNGVTTKPINLPYPLFVLPGTDVCITSPNLVSASVYYDGDVTPYTWSFNNTTGVIHVGMPASGGLAIVIYVTTALGNSFQIPIIRSSNVSSMSAEIDNGQICVSLIRDENISERTSIEDPDRGYSTEAVSWTLEVYNAMTGKKVFCKEVTGLSYIVDTTGWKPEVYIVKAIIGDEVMSEKLVVK